MDLKTGLLVVGLVKIAIIFRLDSSNSVKCSAKEAKTSS